MRYKELRPVREGESRDCPPDDVKELAAEILYPVNQKHLDPKAPILLSGLDVKNYRKPAVYAWKRGERWLYIGVCIRGIGRIFSDHHVIENKAAIADGDYFLIYPQKDYPTALAAEKAMILEHEPEYNTALLQHKRRVERLKVEAVESAEEMERLRPEAEKLSAAFLPIFEQFFPAGK